MPSTWLRWGMDANGDGVADPWNPDDAIFAAARYLAAAGGRDGHRARRSSPTTTRSGTWTRCSRSRASTGRTASTSPFTLRPDARPDVQAAEQAIATQNRRRRPRQRATSGGSRVGHAVMYARADAAPLLSDRLALEKRAFQVGVERGEASVGVGAPRQTTKLEGCRAGARAGPVERVDELHAAAVRPRSPPRSTRATTSSRSAAGRRSSRSATTTTTIPPPTSPRPQGSPLYALDRRLRRRRVARRPTGNCGIGLTMRAAGDGREWTYCHMSYVDPGVQPGVAVAAGAARRSRRLDGARDRPASPSPASAGELVPAGRAVVRALRGHGFPLAGRADNGRGPPSSTVVGDGSAAAVGRSRGDHVHGRRALTSWPSLPKSEVWLCGSASSCPRVFAIAVVALLATATMTFAAETRSGPPSPRAAGVDRASRSCSSRTSAARPTSSPRARSRTAASPGA